MSSRQTVRLRLPVSLLIGWRRIKVHRNLPTFGVLQMRFPPGFPPPWPGGTWAHRSSNGIARATWRDMTRWAAMKVALRYP